MPRSSFDGAAIEAEIGRIRSLGVDALRSLWRVTFRAAPPPGFTKDLIARFLCWHIQEQAFGGLDPKTANHLAGLGRGDRSPANHPGRLKPGTLLVREYQGERHTVTVVANGFVWREATYASLSTIARAITGTNWNGPRFFGLRIDKETTISPDAADPPPRFPNGGTLPQATSAQRFVSVHAAVYNTFNVQRHLISRTTHRRFRTAAHQCWREATAAVA
jgi:Protein of unknown function (DUF2924)